MAPQIALFFCTIFVIILLWLDGKQAPEISLASWIPTLWMLLIVSKPLGVWLNMSGTDMESGSPLDRAFLLLLLFIGLMIVIKRQLNWTNVLRENVWLMILIGYMLISILWSDMPFVSFKRWTREIVAVVMALVILSEPDFHRALESIFRRTIYILIPYSYILIHYFSHLGRQYGRWSGEIMWIGVTTQKNGLGRLCIFSTFFLIWILIRRWREKETLVTWYQTYLEGVLLLLTLWLFGGPNHSLTYSSTSTATLFAGLICFLGLLWMKKRSILPGKIMLIVIITFIIAYGTITPFIGKLSIIDLSSALGREETLTGRADIWALLTPFAMNQPVFGHGVGGFWTDDIREMTSAHAHNGYLDIILDYGFVGVFLFTFFIISCSLKAYKLIYRNYYWGIFLVCSILMLLVYNITETAINSLTGFLTAVVLFSSVSSFATTIFFRLQFTNSR